MSRTVPVAARRAARPLSVMLAAVLVLLVPGASAARADPATTVADAQAQVKDLREQAEVATEKYNAAQEQITALNVKLEAAQGQIDDQRESVAAAREELGRLAADVYKAGDLASLSILLGDDPDAALAADGTLTSLNQRQADAVAGLLASQKRLASTLTTIQEQKDELADTKAELASTKEEINAKLDDADEVLAQLTAEQVATVTANLYGTDTATFEALGITVPSSGVVTCDDVPVSVSDSRVQQVLDYACAQLGDPYVWGGSGPDSFDCSGLTMQAWAAAGVSLPHNAASQATYGTTVSSSELQPGDLVFFYSPISHVAIYLGSGVMLHAPSSGDVVKIAPMRYSDMITAVRL